LQSAADPAIHDLFSNLGEQKKSRSEERLSRHLKNNLRNNLGNFCAPVSQLRTRVAAPEIRRQPCVVGACLVDVFRRNPNGIAVAGRAAVIAPARPTSELAERVISRESIIGPCAFGSYVKIPDADYGVNSGVTGARIMVVTQQSKGHHAAAALCDGQRRVG